MILSSDRTGTQEQRTEKQRILKSHQVTGVGAAFPALEQVAGRDLPSSLSQGRREVAAGVLARATASEVDVLLLAAREAEERAAAMERRAAALLQEVEEAAGARLQEAAAQVDSMLNRAVAAVEHIEREARERGHASGHEEGFHMGLEAGEAEAAELMGRTRSEADRMVNEAHAAAEAMLAAAKQESRVTLEQAQRDRVTLLDASRAQLIDLVFAVARQVLKAELTVQPAAVVPMVEAALAKLKGEEEPQMRVGPVVAALLEEYRGRLLAAVPGARRLAVELDQGMGPGDFVVQGDQGVVDGRIEQQLRVLRQSLEGER